jgi:hypothetical protein
MDVAVEASLGAARLGRALRTISAWALPALATASASTAGSSGLHGETHVSDGGRARKTRAAPHRSVRLVVGALDHPGAVRPGQLHLIGDRLYPHTRVSSPAPHGCAASP